jgi:hypothetical protein
MKLAILDDYQRVALKSMTRHASSRPSTSCA